MDEKNKSANRLDNPEEMINAIREFITILLPVRVKAEDFHNDVDSAFWKIADDLGIGHIEVKFGEDELVLGREQMSGIMVFHRFEADMTASLLYSRNYSIYQGGDVTILFYPVKGKNFEDKEIGYINLFSDLFFTYAGRFRLSRALSQMRNTDILTSLPNLYGYYEKIDELIKRNEIFEYNAYFFNLRDFRSINDQVGHENGNQVIKLYARTVAAFCEEKETIARLGGDNFVALIKRSKNTAFLNLIKQVKVMVEKTGEKREVLVSSVAGCFEIDGRVKTAGDIMMPLSVAIQLAKETGKDSLFYTAEMDAKMMRDQKAGMLFEASLEAGEFIPYFQPKIDMKTGRLCGAEALARWVHEGKMIPPSEFIPALERDGRITRLDFEILRGTCALISKWKKEGRMVPPIAVNLSKRNLRDPELCDKLLQILARYRVSPNNIIFELTETYEYGDITAMAVFFKELKARGIATAIDDFGTGQSSMNLIRRVRPDVLKLDKDFLKGISDDEETEPELIKSVINLAYSMNIEVVAEGVETEAQKDLLLDCGCERAQGFLYDKPIAATDFEKRYLYVE